MVNKLGDKIQIWYQTKKERWSFKMFHFAFTSFLIPILVAYFTVLLISSSPKEPDIKLSAVYNSGKEIEYGGRFKIKKAPDKKPWLVISAHNRGRAEASDFKVELKLLTDASIITCRKEYIPDVLKHSVENALCEKEVFYEKIKSLPSESGVNYKLILNRFIKSPEDFRCSVLSKTKNWSKSLKLSYIRFLITNTSLAYASDREAQKKQSEIPGYDPVSMASNLLELLKTKDLIRETDVIVFEKKLKGIKEGLLFEGVDVLEFFKHLITALRSNDILNKKQEKVIYEKAKKAGGILVDGYNITAIQLGILDALFDNGRITVEEGQRVVDGSIYRRPKPPTNLRIIVR